MSAWMPGAVQRPISKNYTPTPRARRDGIVLHTAASEGTGADHAAYWNRDASAQASSTFYVDRDGTITQFMPLEARSWATAEGNWRTCSVETQGQGTEAWTNAQVSSLARIIAWASSVEGWPIRAMENTAPTQRGVGWHSLTYGGESWNPSGHACPGPKRVAQIPTIIARAQSGATTQETDMDNTQAKQLANVNAKVDALWKWNGGGGAATEFWRIRQQLSQLQATTTAQAAAIEALAASQGLDGPAITQAVTDAVHDALEGLEVTLATKEA